MITIMFNLSHVSEGWGKKVLQKQSSGSWMKNEYKGNVLMRAALTQDKTSILSEKSQDLAEYWI